MTRDDKASLGITRMTGMTIGMTRDDYVVITGMTRDH